LIKLHSGNVLYEEFDNHKFLVPFEFFLFSCSTCDSVNVLGGFKHEIKDKDIKNLPHLYPKGSGLQPPFHQWCGNIPPIPEKIIKLYDDVWFLQQHAPNAFANQIRRGLEMICNDKKATGSNLSSKLKNLVSKGFFPDYFHEVLGLIRKIGNLGSHDDENEVDVWDAELLDQLFKIIIEFVYIAPSKIERFKQRVSTKII